MNTTLKITLGLLAGGTLAYLASKRKKKMPDYLRLRMAIHMEKTRCTAP